MTRVQGSCRFDDEGAVADKLHAVASGAMLIEGRRDVRPLGRPTWRILHVVEAAEMPRRLAKLPPQFGLQASRWTLDSTQKRPAIAREHGCESQQPGKVQRMFLGCGSVDRCWAARMQKFLASVRRVHGVGSTLSDRVLAQRMPARRFFLSFVLPMCCAWPWRSSRRTEAAIAMTASEAMRGLGPGTAEHTSLCSELGRNPGPLIFWRAHLSDSGGPYESPCPGIHRRHPRCKRARRCCS